MAITNGDDEGDVGDDGNNDKDDDEYDDDDLDDDDEDDDCEIDGALERRPGDIRH